MNWIYDNNHIIENQEMITKHQLAFNLNAIIINYTRNSRNSFFVRCDCSASLRENNTIGF